MSRRCDRTMSVNTMPPQCGVDRVCRSRNAAQIVRSSKARTAVPGSANLASKRRYSGPRPSVRGSSMPFEQSRPDVVCDRLMQTAAAPER